MTPVRTLATVRHHGMELADHEFTVPLDHDAPAGETLTIFARAVKHSEKAAETRPWLVFLQGGPEFPGPRPLKNNGWLKRAEWAVIARALPANRLTRVLAFSILMRLLYRQQEDLAMRAGTPSRDPARSHGIFQQ